MAAADPDLVSRLRPVRLPPGFDAFDWQGTVAIFALALLAGLLLALALRALTVPRPTIAAETDDALDAARSLPADERLLRQAAVVAALNRDAEAKGKRGEPARQRLAVIRTTIDAELYRPKPALDPDGLDADIRSVLGARRPR
ncbi:hypothetical protein [Jiella avicenniae]|uniref:Uncharacterized protein n=1 Tax=Jiella avicenniae TaxID=2907202 RepID=A0A9X1P502_9HYPH|nr:hypothetical protein [Jiella avicenniae]MCE7030496.1 hypothetical protein [Jiella avicenniae]